MCTKREGAIKEEELNQRIYIFIILLFYYIFYPYTFMSALKLKRKIYNDDSEILFTVPSVAPSFNVTVVNSTAVNVSWQV